uniref:Uncharacterized protein n=1 Tax=Oryza nivara TaxID=4536 RepID=A0A0E0IDB8_ORYNI
MGDRADDEKAVLAPTLSCADLVRGDGSRAAGGGDVRGGGGMAGSGTLLSGSGAGGRAPTPGSEAAGARGAGRRWLKAAGMAMAAGTWRQLGAEAAAVVPWLRRRGAWWLRRWCPQIRASRPGLEGGGSWRRRRRCGDGGGGSWPAASGDGGLSRI